MPLFEKGDVGICCSLIELSFLVEFEIVTCEF